MRSLLLPAALLLSALAVWGQTDNAALSGRIMDPTGGAIIGADVTVTNTATGTTLHVVTNDAGLYNFSSLPPGTYTLTAKAPGFQQIKQEGLTLHVQDRVGQNITLPVGSSEQTVTVVAEASQ